MSESQDLPSIFTGCFLDEKCAVFAAKVERHLELTLRQSREHAIRHGSTFVRSFRQAMRAYQSFGLDKERDLTSALNREDPMLATYQKFTILSFANSLAEGQHKSDDPDFQVTAMLPTTGQFLQEVHVQLGLQESVAESMMDDMISMRLGTMNCIRLALLKFVQPKRTEPDSQSAFQPRPEPLPQPPLLQQPESRSTVPAYEDMIDEIQPCDSISQVAQETNDKKSTVSNSLFNKRVQERLEEMREHVPHNDTTSSRTGSGSPA